jgi:hypothetical protein
MPVGLAQQEDENDSPPTEGMAGGQGWVSSGESFPLNGTHPVRPPWRMSTPPMEGIF